MKAQNYKVNKNKGFSLIEIMVALVIGIILLGGLISVFETSSVMNRTQNGLARIQENGRFATVHIKQNAEQAGYQYCLASSLGAVGTNLEVVTKPWVIYSNAISPGLPNRADIIGNGSQNPPPVAAGSPLPYLLDPAYFIHGHECGAAACSPTLASLGSATQFAIPAIGVGDGNRLANTDVLTFRYISGKGIDVNTITTIAGTATINYTNVETVLPSVGGNVVIASCDGQDARVISLVSSIATGATANLTGSINASPESSTRLFDFANGLSEVSYYVANNQVLVNGSLRDVPTLYNVVNGVNNALIEGVDRFDVLYGVKTITGNVLMLDAAGVEGLPVAQCVLGPTSELGNIVNIAGCGWRSVVSMEVHLLLNTVYNSSLRNNEPYRYSLDGQAFKSPSDLNLLTGINNYQMYRKEFVSNITVKNY